MNTSGAHVTGAWRQALDDWSTWMRAAGRPESTIYLRVYHLRRLAGVSDDPWAVSERELLAFLAAGERWAAETRRSHRASIRAFYKWASTTGRVDVDPSAGLPQVLVRPGVPRPAPERAVRTALDDADPRVELMVSLAAFAGLRRAEVAAVHVRDVQRDLDGWRIRVRGKGDRVRTVPISDELGRALLAAGGATGGWLFPSGSARSSLGHLTPAHVGKLVSRVLPDGLAMHTLRHRYGTVTYRGSRRLLHVSALLGHVRAETTQVYVRLADDELREVAMHASTVAA